MKSQKNYNWYTNYKGEKIEFITSKSSPSFNIKAKKNGKMNMYYALILGFIILIVLLYFLRKKKKPLTLKRS
jgi:LPXTG-motif cell wall-anchored protein